MDIFSKLNTLLGKPAQLQMGVLLLMMMIGMALETLGLGLVVSSIALMTHSTMEQNYPVIQSLLRFFNYPSQIKLITIGLSALVLLYIIKTLFILTINWKRNQFIFNVQADLSYRLFKGYIEQPWTFHLQKNSAELIHNAMNEVGVFSTVALQSSLILLSEGLVLMGISAVLLAMEPAGTAIVLGFLALVVLIFNRSIRHRVSTWGKIRQEYDANRLQYLQQGLGGAKDAKLLGRESEFINQFHKQNQASLNISQKLGTLTEVPRLMLELLLVTSLACVIIPLILQGRPPQMLLPTVGLFAAAAFRLMPSVNRILGAMQNLRYSYPSLQTLYNEVQSLIPLDLSKNTPLNFNDKIVLDRVSYKYPNVASNALDSICLTIPQGASIGFIGKSGAGKSTLVDVILGLLTPQEGAISVDGIDIQKRLRGWQNHIGYVPQTIFLTDDTLRRNIAFGLPEEQIDEYALETAIKAAHLQEFINSLPDGVNTFVGERGVRLSGGQRQRVGIARALYHNPKIVVLDEATSSLDTMIEKEVMNDINCLHGEKTLIIVAHRLSTLQKCDVIYCLEQGKIIYSGNFVNVIDRYNVQNEKSLA